MSKETVPGLPIIRSVQVPGGGKLVIMRLDAFRTAIRAANAASGAPTALRRPGLSDPMVGKAQTLARR